MKRALLFFASALGAVAAVAGGLWALGVFGPPSVEDPSLRPPMGVRAVDPGSLRDVRGSRRALDELAAQPAVVLAFLASDCPLVNQYVPRLVEWEAKLRRQGVVFVAVYPLERESLDAIAAHSQDRKIPFLVLKDVRRQLADELGVTRTPTVCVLDSGLVLRYRGRIDDQYALASRRSAPTKNDLLAAIADVVAKRRVQTPTTVVDGCVIEDSKATAPSRTPTYSADVASVLRRRCEACHRPGQSAPFSLQTYTDAVAWAPQIREVVAERRMPPWHADPRYGVFSNDRRLSDDEVAKVVQWVELGTPRGDPKDDPPAENWPKGWARGEPDAVVEQAIPADVPADGPQQIVFSPIPKETTDKVFDRDRWLRAAEVQPGQPSVVHHISVYVVRPGAAPPPQSLSEEGGVLGWAPGEPLYAFPEGSALFIPKGSTLVFELHYAPSGKAVQDRSRIGLYFSSQPPRRELKLQSPGDKDLAIPPRDPNYESVFVHTFTTETRLLGLMGHMHTRGKAYRFEAVYPDGRSEILLSVPRYDFYWQTFYWFANPPTLPKGTRLRATGVWDNSRWNLNNPNPDSMVFVGPTSDKEMLSCWMFYEKRPDAAATPQK